MIKSPRALLIGAVLAAGMSSMPAHAQQAPQGDTTNGQRAYLATGCMYCHGRAGQGGGMNYPAPPLAKTQMPAEAFKNVVRGSLRDMPAFVEAVLPEKDLTDIYAFVQSLPGRRDPKSLAILND